MVLRKAVHSLLSTIIVGLTSVYVKTDSLLYEDEKNDAKLKAACLLDVWGESCSIVARQYKLSPRESEVLLLLSTGRNTERISELLCISMHTVKTHTYHIYQKIGISSQQQIIDMIEANIKPIKAGRQCLYLSGNKALLCGVSQ